ncbi:hypothetical protein LTR99_011174 [Exophiala xenobiotica]|uniref:Uncharacterized protein n=1 Tax=Vermiconidia calcicola TaxID=1690605 RepID=A0AAV9PT34_9PEZI|nr:hypothetical protein LTR99_011174 [Exophiala xenobiotica]KAK5425413.1 hypothetical protein LTR34_011137 [Exophiala xenobiotica]KAK5527476.1 hypothetical protein LTR25_011166 [Vermiconidia calcicola]KAK5527921.1 hypothetical protein LTR23_011168 [Chaetothyriales sp. CCFEE 6169]
MPQPRYHTVIFVESKDDKSGIIHHVVGGLVTGMTYQRKSGLQPELSQNFYQKHLLGKVKASKYHTFETICAQQPAPHKQKKFNPNTMKTEPIKPNGAFYQPGETRVRLVKCTEWTEERAIPALQAAQILE